MNLLRFLPARAACALAALLAAAALPAAPAVVDLNAPRQVIRGFGGATVFRPTEPLSDADLDALFGNGPGQIGFTLLRIRVAEDDAWRALELANARGAKARGAAVIATPWSPPAAMKTNNSLIGGSLKPSAYAAYATYLNDFARYMMDHGAALYAISVQNEPDYSVTYESCDWTPDQMLTFCRDHAGAITLARVIAPESFQFRRNISDPLLNNATAAANVDIIGGHIYGGGLADYPLARQQGKEVWMTEHLDLSTDWAGALATGRELHDCLAVANFSAYFWWYLKRYYGPLGEDGVVTKRGAVMAQFAKFVRPGFVRVDATENPATGVRVSAFKGPQVVIVAVNEGTADVAQTFTVQNADVRSVTPWVTTSTVSLQERTPVPVAAGSFTVTLPAGSVTTLVGDRVVPPPSITGQPRGHTLAAGSTFVLEVGARGEFLTYQWARGGQPLPGATGRRLTVRNAQAAQAGLYTVTVANAGGSVTSAPAGIAVVTTANPGRLIALSTRSTVGTGYDVQIGGFVVAGPSPKPILVRAAGPALSPPLGAASVLADPTIELHDQLASTLLATVDDWDASLAGTFQALGEFPFPAGSKDAAVLRTFAPGIYTAVVKGKNDGTGVALVEIYDAAPADSGTRLIALATRSLVRSGAEVQIGGFALGGATARTVVIRAAGPALATNFGVTGVLPDPVIELHDQLAGTTLATATGWEPDLEPHFQAVGAGAWPDGSADTAFVTTLDPGVYTAIVQSRTTAAGVAILEIFDEP